MKSLPLNLVLSLTATPLIFSRTLCLYPSISRFSPHLSPPPSSRALSSPPPPPPVNVSLSLSSCPPPPPSFLLYHFIGLLVPLEMPNDKQSKPSEPLPCCPHRAADSKQTGYELKHSHSPPPPAHHKSSYRI